MLMDWHALMDKVDFLCDEHFGEPVLVRRALRRTGLLNTLVVIRIHRRIP